MVSNISITNTIKKWFPISIDGTAKVRVDLRVISKRSFKTIRCSLVSYQDIPPFLAGGGGIIRRLGKQSIYQSILFYRQGVFIFTKQATYIYIYIYIYHVTPSVRISLTLFRHPSQSSIASDRYSGLHPVSTQSCCM